ncbi:MAG TPA: anthranilate synthase component I family protein [Candidatus Acidoferrales bacterium]|nr:anthranilate synthase component I family protein [Candidatus Acidoferrales bacterium]
MLVKPGGLVVTSESVQSVKTAPIDAFSILRHRLPGPALLLETRAGRAARDNRTVLAFGAAAELLARDGLVRVSEGAGSRSYTREDVNAACRDLMRSINVGPDAIHPAAGAYGLAAFEYAGYHERPCSLPATQLPDLHLIVPQVIVVFDPLTEATVITTEAGFTDVAMLLQRGATITRAGARAKELPRTVAAVSFRSAVGEAKRAIREGEIFQAVLSQAWSFEVQGDPLEAYRRLRALNPSPYAFHFELPWGTLFGTSPEMLCTLDQGTACIRPLAGTRPRSANSAAEALACAALLADPKERAEHVMLVDLARNDLGRVCEYGSVRVDEFLGIEKYSHVMHLVSDVRGTLRTDRDAFDLFAAAFPAGTVSGAPKIRAMQLIAELEGERRGWYGGALLHAGFDGSLDSCIILRSAMVRDGVATVRAGAGIVADSIAAREDAECRAKAQAVVEALLAEGAP